VYFSKLLLRHMASQHTGTPAFVLVVFPNLSKTSLSLKSRKEVNKRMLKMTKLVLSLIAVTGFLMVATNTFAQSSPTKPGWGFGDKNHVHTGPPGQTVVPGFQNNATVNTSVSVSSNSGGNNANNTAEGGIASIITGATSTMISIVNSINQSLFGS
jgi:hypothetical protein